MTRGKSKPAADEADKVVARITLTKGRQHTTLEFQEAEVGSGEDGFVVVKLKGAKGDEAVFEFAASEARKLVSWRMLTGF